MNECNKTKILIDRYLNNEETPLDIINIQEHSQKCATCNAYLEAALIVKPLLKSYDEKDFSFPNGFIQNLHIKLAEINEQEHKKEEKKLFFTLDIRKFLLGTAAFSLVIMITFAFFFMNKNNVDKNETENMELISRAAVSSEKPIVITLEYSAAREIRNTAVTIELDEGIEFYSLKEERRLLRKYIWKGNLEKGENKISFAVQAVKKGIFLINTRADFEGLSHQHKAILNVSKGGTTVALYRHTQRIHP